MKIKNKNEILKSFKQIAKTINQVTLDLQEPTLPRVQTNMQNMKHLKKQKYSLYLKSSGTTSKGVPTILSFTTETSQVPNPNVPRKITE